MELDQMCFITGIHGERIRPATISNMPPDNSLMALAIGVCLQRSSMPAIQPRNTVTTKLSDDSSHV